MDMHAITEAYISNPQPSQSAPLCRRSPGTGTINLRYITVTFTHPQPPVPRLIALFCRRKVHRDTAVAGRRSERSAANGPEKCRSHTTQREWAGQVPQECMSCR